jgi:hypothetical protein
MTAGRYGKGCPAIAESLRLDPRPGTLFTLALCEDKWGHVLSAVTHYEEYLALYAGLPAEKKAKQGERPKVARAQVDSLRPQIPEVTVTLPRGTPRGTLVKRDGDPLPPAALGAPIRVDPGAVTFTTQTPGGPVRELRLTIGKGEKKTVALQVDLPTLAPIDQPPPAAPPEDAPPPRATSAQRKAAYAFGAVGIGGLALGAILGGLALGRKGTLDAHCGAAIGAPDAKCDPVGMDAAPRAKAFAAAGTVGVLAGVAALGTGVVLFATDRPPASPEAGALGRWVTSEILIAGTGATLSLRGTW